MVNSYIKASLHSLANINFFYMKQGGAPCKVDAGGNTECGWASGPRMVISDFVQQIYNIYILAKSTETGQQYCLFSHT